MSNYYPVETLDEDDDDGTMISNVAALTESVVGRRIIKAERRETSHASWSGNTYTTNVFVITLDNGTEVQLANTSDCCAYTDLETFLLHPDKVNHVIMGIGTSEYYTRWHIYADMGDVLELAVGWSCGNPFYYGYGFDIDVVPVS